MAGLCRLGVADDVLVPEHGCTPSRRLKVAPLWAQVPARSGPPATRRRPTASHNQRVTTRAAAAARRIALYSRATHSATVCMPSQPPTSELLVALSRFATWSHRLSSDVGLMHLLLAELERAADNSPELSRLVSSLHGPLSSIGTVVDHLSGSYDGDAFGLPDAVEVQLEPVVRDVMQDYNHHRFAGEAVTFKTALDLPSIASEPLLLAEILRNLLDNAIAAFRPSLHPPAIEVSAFQLDNNKVYLEVHDNGSGFSQDAMKAFSGAHVARDPEPRGAGTTARPQRLGRGLQLSQMIVALWDGELQLVESAPGSTRLRLALNPWRDAPPPTSPRVVPAQPPEEPKAEVSNLPDSLRVLVVDDNLEMTEAVSRAATDRYPGAEVDSATSSEQALRLIQTEIYDLALVDLVLGPTTEPEGLSVVSAVRRANPEALIVVMTGRADLEVMRTAVQLGADDLYPKAGVSFGELFLSVERLASARESARRSLRERELNHLMYDAMTAISHELRAPLVTVQRHAEALISGALGDITPQQLEALDRIVNASTRQSTLLNAHIDLKRIATGTASLRLQECDPAELLFEELQAHADAAKEKGVRLTFDAGHVGRHDRRISVDADRIRVAMNPLLDNAVRYSPQGGEVHLSLRWSDCALIVELSDEGPGIPQHELAALLGGDSPRARLGQRIRSSGLGLSMANRFIEAHGGNLSVSAGVPRGTTVRLTLPLNPAPRTK